MGFHPPFTTTGEVFGPGSSTDNAVVRFDGTTGTQLQNSTVLLDDAGAFTGVTTIDGFNQAYSGADITVGSANADFTTIQGALDAVPSTGATIYVSDGTYTITTTLLIKQSNTRLIFSAGAIIQCNGGTVTTLIKANTTGLNRIEIWGGKWLQTTASAVGTAFDMSDISDSIIHPTRIEEFNIGLKIDDTSNATFYNRYKEIQIFNCNTCIQIGVTSTSTQPNNNYFEAIRCRPKAGGAGYGVRIADARGLTFISCDFEPSSGTGITGISLEQNATSLGYARECAFINCWDEANAIGVSIALGALRNSFYNCTITGSLTTDIVDNEPTTVFINTNENATTKNKMRANGAYTIITDGTNYHGFNLLTGYHKSSTTLDTVWNDIISTIAGSAAVIEFGPGSFTTTTGLYFTQNNLKIKGQGKGTTIVQASTAVIFDSQYFFGCLPSQSATKYALTVDATKGDLTLTMSSANLISSGITTGSYILLSSLLSIDTEIAGRFQGELHKVLSVNTGTGVITIGSSGVGGTGVYQTMLISDTATVCLLTFYNDVSVQGITFTDTATSRPNTLGSGQCLFEFIDNLTILDCEFKNMFDSGTDVRQCMNVKIDNCHFRDIKDVTPSANTYYGHQTRGATINIAITNCTFDNMRHGVTSGAGSTSYTYGTSRNISVTGCTFISTTTAHMDCHQGAEGVTFAGNTMTGDDSSANGIQSRSPLTVTGNNITGIKGLGISLFGNAHASTISGNVISGCTTGINISNGARKPLISGNTISGGSKAIALNRTTGTVTITIASPAVITYTAHSITPNTRVTFSTSGALPTGITVGTVYYVIATGMTVNTFQISATLGGSAVNTSGTQSGTQTIAYYSGDDATIVGNTIIDNSSTGMTANGQINVKLSDNVFNTNQVPFILTDTDSVMSGWVITDNYSHGHTSTDKPTIAGTNPIMRDNVGFGAEQPGGYIEYTTGPQTLDITNRVVNCTSGTFTVNLPTVVNIKSREYIIKNSGTGVITVDGSGSETIDGNLTYVLNQYDSIVIEADGTSNWILVPSINKNRNQLRIKGSGLITETYPIGGISSSGLMVTQTVYYGLVGLFRGDIVTNINVAVATQGTASTSTFVAILDSAGNRLAVSNDLTTILDTAGTRTLALSAPYTVLADGAYYLAVLTISSVPATLQRGSSTANVLVAVGSGVRPFASQTGQSTIPTTATFSNSGFAYWMAVS